MRRIIFVVTDEGGLWMHAPLGEKLASCWPGSTGGGACIADSALGAHGHGLLGMFLAQTD